MIQLTTSTKLVAAGVALSLGWIILSACDCDETKEQNYPGFWVACVNNKPTLMTYNDNNATTVTSDAAGNFDPSEYDCSHAGSPQYKGSESASPFLISSPAGPGGFARPHTAPTTYAFNPRQLLSLPFTPFVPPPTPVCQSNFPDVFHTNHSENTVVRISTCPFAVKTTIPVFQRPLQVAVTPDGSTAVVTSFGDLDGDGGALTFINLSNNQITSTLMMQPGVTPNGLAISPDGTTAYVGNFTNPGQSILVVNIPTQTVTATIQNVLAYPSGMTLSPDGSQLWVASPLSTETDVFDTLSQTLAYRLNIQQSVDIAFNSTGTLAYVTSDLNNPGQVFVVDTSTFRILSTYTVGNGPSDIAMSYGDQFLVVNNDLDGSVSVIDLRQDMVTTTQVGSGLSGIAFVQYNDMIPYFPQPVLHLGPLQIHAFGFLAALAVLVGGRVILLRAHRQGIPVEQMFQFCCWTYLSAMVCAVLAKLILDNFPAIFLNPGYAFHANLGFRSVGGIAGGFLGGMLWCRWHRLSVYEMMRRLDMVAYATPLAWMIGRLGCTLAHDHRGLFTTSWIAVRFPEGSRYDLGLIEFLFLIPLTIAFYLLDRKPRPVGFYLGLYGVVYGGFRIWLDTLHAQPLRFYGGAVGVLVGLLGWAWMWAYGRSHTAEPAVSPATV